MSVPRFRSNSTVASWFHRKAQLQTLLGNCGDDEEEGIALDRILHGQSVIGKTQKSINIENVRFSDKDLNSFGPLADAQFGTVELVNCRLDGRVYVRKRISKKFALKAREQCSPQSERHILLLSLKSQSRSSLSWTPQMLCAYQCSSFLNIVMEYAAGGSLWDVLESSAEGRLSATDLAWWAPQCVSAIEWLHSRAGFVHRDIKPHNFVVRPGPAARLLLIDFGSAAPLLTPGPDGVQHVPRSNCLVPCGTCDYISPEILRAHEEALVALEMSDDECEDVDDSDAELRGRWKGKRKEKILQDDVGYGRETDWWSLGAMLYELAFGVAPFFASDIRQTYARIMNHKSSLIFDRKAPVPPALVSLIKGLLTHHENRLGRRSVDELRNHAYFKYIDWSNIHSCPSPPDLLLPEFTYTTPLVPPEPQDDNSESSADASKPFAFSALFQSSVTSKPDASSVLLYQQDPMATPAFGRRSMSRSGSAGSAQRSIASFIGFSWGPPKDAFDDATRIVPAEPASTEPGLCAPSFAADADPAVHQHPLITPMRPSRGVAPPSTVRVTSVRRSAQARPVSDREAMRVLVTCVGQSARKRVLESGKKPKVLLPNFGYGLPPPVIAGTALGDSFRKGRPRAPSTSRSPVTSAVRKELRFDDTTTQIMPNLSYTNTFTTTFSNSGMSGGAIPYVPPPYSASDSGTMSSETEGPPSPSPSPRPGSAMSMLSMSRRSATPTVSSAYLMGVPVRSSSEPPELRPRPRAGSLGSMHGDGGRNGVISDAKELQTPRRPRFANSPSVSPEPPKERVPPTPHPQARRSGAKEQRTPRRAQFADSPALFRDTVKRRMPGTPRPRAESKAAKEKRTPRRTHFANLPAETSEVIKERVPPTPHPQAKAQTRRNTNPPLESLRSRAVSSTPARPGLRRKKAQLERSSDEDEPIRRQSRSRSSSLNRSEGGREKNGKTHVSGMETETPPDKDELDEQSRIASPYGPDKDSQPDCDHKRYGSLRMYDDVQRRYERLKGDLANVRLRIDEFVSLACNGE